MKPNSLHKFFILTLFLSGIAFIKMNAQDSAVFTPELSVHYFLPANKIPYIEVSTNNKLGKKSEPIQGIPVAVYFSEALNNNLIGKIITGLTGKGRVALPPSFKATWDSLTEFKFMAVSDSTLGVASLSGDVTIKKAILVIDTSSSEESKMVTAQLQEKKGNEWVPVKDIEMYLGIKRKTGNLNVIDNLVPEPPPETFISDSTGTASASFEHDSMPGDDKGNIVLVARVSDVENDGYGNLVVEKTVPWGVAFRPDNNFFDQRTLWSKRSKTPIWLLFMAYSITLGIWGTIIYLVRQMMKIKKLSKDVQAS
jgi:hypothetical protein